VSKRKILVFAHVPPPHHGQSVMVAIMLEGLRADPRFEVHHVDARVSDDLEDVGSFRPQKFWRLFKCIAQAWWIRLRHGRMAFYYVPAPAKRSAIMRDWMVMAFCRPLFPELILHWHAYGLGEWVAGGNDWQRKLSRWALGKADLSIVLNNYNKRDAEVFAPKRIEVVPNGIADQFPDYEEKLAPKRKARAATLRALQEPTAEVARFESGKVERQEGKKLEVVRFLFLGHLIETKGVFVAIEATRLANEELRQRNAPWRAHLTLAGSFASEEEKGRVLAAMEKANKISHGWGKIEEDRSARLADARTGGDALSRETPAQGGFALEEQRHREGGKVGKWEGTKAAGNEGACVELAGFLDSGQKKSALVEADCLVFPTFYESEAQPLVLLEAMSAGLPVITTTWRGVPEVLPVGGLHACAIRNPEEVSRLMSKVVDFAEFAVYREVFLARFEVNRFIASMAKAFDAAN
jgi:glycosyltransferase involved in cell wall biosynthesis